MGITAIIFPIAIKKNTAWKEIPLSFLAAVVVFTVANDVLIDHTRPSAISRIDGIIMILFFTIFIVYNITLAKTELFPGLTPAGDKPLGKSAILLTAGIILLITGGRLIVFSAVRVAAMIGMSERIIALTVVSVGTSLPELATSVIAALKKNTDIAIGNAIGSNIYNIFLVLGLSAVINPVDLQPGADMDLLFNIGASMLLFVFVFTGRGRTINRTEGILFLLVYAVYISLLIRG
jgi:cation:H+ antiporter